MNYRFLANKALNEFFEESELSVGEILRSLLRESSTGIKIENKARITEITDSEWYEIIEKTRENEQE